ncbi:MAG: pantetheine-phosphate adenylyltransferase [Myxococcales bacterium]|nr:pantetheine-phosphate adenylyltransferase [Myxococcales bacterium]|tara:strand:- start:504 stop:989 length:486 start_codon:yes stop_codon:yes gene_type:complete
MTEMAIYPGSFDPPTRGHLDIIQRGVEIFDHVVVAVANNPQKHHLFTLEERLTLLQDCVGHMPSISLDSFDGLLVDYVAKKGGKVLLRGLRAVSDFEYEFQLATMNRQLAPNIETMFMMTGSDNFYLSSKLVREVASYGGDVKDMVPDNVNQALIKKFSQK